MKLWDTFVGKHIRGFAKYAYLASVVVVIFALAVELVLVMGYRDQMELGRSFEAGNVFGQTLAPDDLREGFRDGLWAVPWERYRPNAVFETELSDGTEFSIRINSHGYRTAEFSKIKQEGVTRIIAIGGSTTIQGNTNETTYPAHMERLLKDRFPGETFEVLNLGISGTSSRFWLDRMDELLAFEPDLVLQYNAINDLAWTHMGEYAAEHPWLQNLNRSLLYQSIRPLDPFTFTPYLEQILGNFLAIKERLRAEGVGYVVASFAMPDYRRAPEAFQAYLDADSGRWGAAMNLRRYQALHAIVDHYNSLFKDFVSKHDIAHVLLDEVVRDPAFFVDSCHMTEAGIEAMATAMADGLTGVRGIPRGNPTTGPSSVR